MLLHGPNSAVVEGMMRTRMQVVCAIGVIRMDIYLKECLV